VPQRAGADQVGATADKAVVHVCGDSEREPGAGAVQVRLQRLGVQHPEQQVDVVADQVVLVAVDGAEVGGGADLSRAGSGTPAAVTAGR
jgi:hypothetical protein